MQNVTKKKQNSTILCNIQHPFLRPSITNPEYDQSPEGYHFDDERDVESSIPYGIQNVYDTASGRIARSKSRHKVYLLFPHKILQFYVCVSHFSHEILVNISIAMSVQARNSIFKLGPGVRISPRLLWRGALCKRSSSQWNSSQRQ